MAKSVKILAIVFAILLLLVPATACRPGPAEGEPYKIGLLMGTTGPVALYGQQAWQGLQFAAEAITASGGINGRPVEAVLYNNEGVGEVTVAGYNKLADQDKVVAVIGPILSTLATTLEPHLMTPRPPSLSFSTSLFPNPASYLFSINHPTETPVNGTFSWLSKQGIKKVGIMADTTRTGEEGVKASEKMAAQYNLELVIQRFDRTAVDVTPQLATLRGQQVEAIFASSTGSSAAVVARNVEQLGMTETPLILSEGNGSQAFIDSVKDITLPKLYVQCSRGFDFQSFAEDDPMKEPAIWVAQALEKKYGELLDPNFAHYAVDAACIVADAVKAKNSTEPTAIKEFLESQTGLPLTGSWMMLTYAPGSHIARAEAYMTAVLHIQGGKYQVVPETLLPLPKGVPIIETLEQIMK